MTPSGSVARTVAFVMDVVHHTARVLAATITLLTAIGLGLALIGRLDINNGDVPFLVLMWLVSTVVLYAVALLAGLLADMARR